MHDSREMLKNKFSFKSNLKWQIIYVTKIVKFTTKKSNIVKSCEVM